MLLAEQANGPIPRRNGSSYAWGAALGRLERMQPDARIINLETAVTRSHDRVNKGINYRVSPENAECLAAAKINCCVLANNHVLDWGRVGGLFQSLPRRTRLPSDLDAFPLIVLDAVLDAKRDAWPGLFRTAIPPK